MIEPPLTTTTFRQTNGRKTLAHSLLIRLGIATAWLAIFLLWGSWLLAAWFYAQAIFTDLDSTYNWHRVWNAAAIRAAATGLGVHPATHAWIQLGIEVSLVVTYGIVGVILFRHKQDGFGAFLGVSLVLIATRIGGPVTFILATRWPVLEQYNNFLSGLAFGAFGALLYLFPNGRFVPRWSPWLIGIMVLPSLGLHWIPEQLNPAFALIYLGVGMGSQVYRYKQLSDAITRRHIRWILVSFAAFVLVIIVGLLIAPNAVSQLQPPSSFDLFFSFIFLMPGITVASVGFVIALSVAILRDGLYNLDIFINRALVYGGLTVLITAVYLASITFLTTLLQNWSNITLALLTTGLIAIIFQPLRARLQSGINRLLYGERDTPLSLLTRLGEILASANNPATILPIYVQTIATSLHLPFAAIWLRQSETQFVPIASHGRQPNHVETIPLFYHGLHIGQLVVALRLGQDKFDPTDWQLFDQIAHQTAAAVNTVRLVNDLQHSRERIITAREEERRRIRRDLHDGLGPSLASQTFALDTALELLDSDPQAAVKLLQALKTQTQVTVADIRRLVYALRPPALDELGLVGALQAHFGKMERGDVGIELTAVPHPLPPLSAAVEVAAYRIILEAVTNTIRHARARRCTITLAATENPAQLQITVQDDGHGLPANRQAGVGLGSMRERAEELGGRLQVENGEEGGVKITAVLPLAK